MDRKTDFCNTGKAIVTVYNMAEDFDGLIWKCFEEDIAEWIDFVCQCRNEEKGYLQYDLIKGKVANDKVYPNYGQIAFSYSRFSTSCFNVLISSGESMRLPKMDATSWSVVPSYPFHYNRKSIAIE